MANDKIVYFGYADHIEGVVLVRAVDFEELSGTYQALYAAKTWRDFWQLLPEHEHDWIKERLVQNAEWHEVQPGTPEGDRFGLRPDAPVDASAFHSADDYWPPVPGRDYIDWIPEEIVADFGTRTSSMISGDWVSFDVGPDRMADFKAAFTSCGYELVRDQVRIDKATGAHWLHTTGW